MFKSLIDYKFFKFSEIMNLITRLNLYSYKLNLFFGIP